MTSGPHPSPLPQLTNRTVGSTRAIFLTLLR
jgi:hypothetical protein